MKELIATLFFTVTCLSLAARSSQPLVINGDHEKLILTGKNLSVFVDSSASLSADLVCHKIQNPNIELGSDAVPYNQLYQDMNYWMQFSIKDLDSTSDWFYLEVPDFHVNHTEVYKIKNGKAEWLGRQGFSEPFDQRQNNYKNPLYIIHPNQEDSYLVKMNSAFGSSYKLYVYHPSHKLDFAVNEYLRLGVYYGVLVIMALYNLFVYLLARQRVYLYYVSYVLACIWYSFFSDGLGFQFLWPSFPLLNSTYSFTSLILLTAFVLYSSNFLNLKEKLPLVNRLLMGFLILYLLVFLYNTWLEPFHQLATWAFVFPYVLILYACISLFRKGQKDIRFFILAYVFLVLSATIHILMRKGIFPDNFIGIYSLNIGIIAEVIFFSLAQGDRIKITNLERLAAQRKVIEQQEENRILQDKVNRELEELVSKRTSELHQKNNELEKSNQQLKDIHQQLNEMNIKLDVTNWKLKKEAVQSTEDILLSKSIDISDFNKVFPDDLSCIRYLSEKKWGSGFVCKKCGNDKAVKGFTLEKKKCSKCNTIESVTAATIFHRLKFPIKNAFYITILTFKNSPITSKELAEKLDMRESTCSTFRKKVREKIASDKPEDFDELVF